MPICTSVFLFICKHIIHFWDTLGP